MSTPPVNTQQHTDTQRELVRVVLKDTLRQHGIPSAWVGCEVTVLPRRASRVAGSSAAGEAGDRGEKGEKTARPEALFVHLIVMKWNNALVHFAPALQVELMQALDRFEPVVDHSGYVVAWRFSPQCGCPYTRMPDPIFWAQDSMAMPTSAPTVLPAAPVQTPPKPKFDLPPSSLDSLPSGFAPTEPAPLR